MRFNAKHRSVLPSSTPCVWFQVVNKKVTRSRYLCVHSYKEIHQCLILALPCSFVTRRAISSRQIRRVTRRVISPSHLTDFISQCTYKKDVRYKSCVSRTQSKERPKCQARICYNLYGGGTESAQPCFGVQVAKRAGAFLKRAWERSSSFFPCQHFNRKESGAIKLVSPDRKKRS